MRVLTLTGDIKPIVVVIRNSSNSSHRRNAKNTRTPTDTTSECNLNGRQCRHRPGRSRRSRRRHSVLRRRGVAGGGRGSGGGNNAYNKEEEDRVEKKTEVQVPWTPQQLEKVWLETKKTNSQSFNE